jgi:hypothetical protein
MRMETNDLHPPRCVRKPCPVVGPFLTPHSRKRLRITVTGP